MMKLIDLVAAVDARAPFATALSFDNSGILCGDPQREIRKVLLSLDITYDVIEQAFAQGVDLILTHHPALFSPQKVFSPSDRVYRLIERGIAAVAAHTNLDAARGGVNDVLAQAVGLTQIEDWWGDDPSFISRKGVLPEAKPLTEYCTFVKQALKANSLRYADGGRPVHKVALCSGSGGDMWESLIGTDIDTLLTGEAKYHHFLEAAQAGINLIEAGHYATENIILPVLEQWLKQTDPSLEILYAQFPDPVRSV
ncbi:MAG: Nif3-like dinuclear metal center hexameric protein [Clostridia bacterium]|nr:Nif3-like dinuclear metal center hexameric protein [Clostridia bacterium]